MRIPKTVKDIQSLIGRVAALTRFISKAADRCAPFFKALKGNKQNITWTAECDKAFSELKEPGPLIFNPRAWRHPYNLPLRIGYSVNHDFTAKDVFMIAYLQHTRHLLATFDAHLISQVPRSENSHADALARLASALEQGIGRHIHIEFLDQPSTQAPLICTIDHSPTWMDPILKFLQNQTLPADSAEARRIRYRSTRYLILNGSLYKWGFSLTYFRCLTPEEGNYVIQEIHKGICGNHSGTRSLAHKAIRQGYFWPSLHTDAQAFTQKCDKCQRFTNIPQLLAEPLTAMVSPWLFA
ncbi:uncharacterized protein LOC109948673 [Prunus persica]|uniref:uncharacterized protein LOC109948673 n=1 Tax=Prunus persica TaxID=3760 RepID=UPI0009AB5EFF|nr:uncharacterized protein LOC109948673 [Prunus persica]